MFGGTTLNYDYDNMSAAKVGRFGFKPAELAKLGSKLKAINAKLQTHKAESNYSFRQLPNDYKNLRQILKFSNYIRHNYDNLVVIGIGGSDLGAKALYAALAGNRADFLTAKRKNCKLFFCGDTTDPQPLEDLIKILNLKKTFFYVVSKSGNTIEPLTAFLFLRQHLISKVGYKHHREQIIITTNTQGGQLLEIAKKEKYLVWPHADCGGRFSALSVNGLLPLACAGYDIAKLLAGARAIDKQTANNAYLKNSPFIFASLQYLAYTRRGQNVSVLMPYNYSLAEFGKWFRQLWGESLANKYNLAKKKVNLGITPIAALGPSDQHSQIQLYIEGPYDKIITFIKVSQIASKLQVPKIKNAGASYLAGHKFADILAIEHKATVASLSKNQRANGTLILPKLNEYYLGQLIYFFEMATVYLGELLGVNVFDQPGVEQSKKFMHGLLGRKGYEEYKKEII